MIPTFIARSLERGPLASHYEAYKDWRWGDAHVRLLPLLCDPMRASVDVGANRGEYVYFLKRWSARVIAFEPNADVEAQLRRRFGASVEIHGCAVSNSAGTAEFRIPIEGGVVNDGRASIERANPLEHAFGTVRTRTVKTVTLDSVMHEPVGFLKIDVEGHEISVLEGAQRILAESRPNLLVELEERHRRGIVARAFAMLREAGYNGWFLRDGRVHRVDDFRPEMQAHPGEPGYVWNFVFSQTPGMGDRLQRRAPAPRGS